MQQLTFENLVDLLLDAVCLVDAAGRFVFVNAAFERIFGYKPEEVIGTCTIDLVHPSDRDLTLRATENVMSGQLQFHFENRYVRKDGQIAHIRWTARWAQEKQLCVAVAHDITARKRTESLQAAVYAISEVAHTAKDLVALFERIHATIGHLLAAEHFAVALYDGEHDALSFPYRTAAAKCLPIHRNVADEALCAEVVHQGKTLLLTPDTIAQLPAHLHSLLNNLPRYWLGVPLHSQSGPLGVLVLQGDSYGSRHNERDRELLQYISTQIASAIERQQMHMRLERMAQYDQLTHLPNRALFLDRLKTALTRADREKSRLSLLFVDLDRFKQVNDTLGHAMGDLLLQRVAQRLMQFVRGSDTVARLGGDEFVVLLESSHTVDHTRTVAEKILAAFASPFDLQGHSLHIQPSIGIAAYPEDGDEESHLLSHADAAMYHAKRNGGNQVNVLPP